MNVNVNRTLETDKQKLGALIDLMGQFGGYDPETFDQEKEAILESGINFETFASILGDNIFDKAGPRERVKVHVQKLTDTAKIPAYAHMSDACCDLYTDADITIEPKGTALVSTGIAVAIPYGYVGHIYPRSSTGLKTPLRLANSVGVIDSEYRGELKLIFTNTSDEPYTVHAGDRVAQMSIDNSPIAQFSLVDDITSIEGDREGGFGSTGESELNVQNKD